MRILFLAPQPFLAKRGTPLAVYQLLRAFSDLGHLVDLVTFHMGEDIEIKGIRLFRTPPLPFITAVKKGVSGTKVLLDLFVFGRAFSLLRRNRYDVIHGVEEGAALAVVLGKLFHLPVVNDMDSSIPDQLRDSQSLLWSSGVVVRAASLLERWTVRHSALVIAVCRSLAEKARRVWPATPVHLLEDIPNVEPFQPAMAGALAALREELGVRDEPVIVYTGTFEAYQGIKLLLESAPMVVARYPSVRLVLVGGEPDQVAAVAREVSRLGVAERVSVLGARPMEEMPLFMEMADILVSPRTFGTNTPMKIYAYLDSGRPIVATRLETHTQVLNDEIAMLVEPQPAAFAEGILRLLSAPGFRDEMGRRGRKYVRTHFSYESFRKKLRDAYSVLETG